MSTQEELAILFGDESEEEQMITPVTSESAQFEEPVMDPAQEDELAVLFGDVPVSNAQPSAAAIPTEQSNPLMTEEQVAQEESTLESFGRKAAIVGGGVLEGAAESIEAIPTMIGGAIDEIAYHVGDMTGVYDPSTFGDYPVQNFVDSFLRFDETANMIVPKSARERKSAGDYALDALSRGAGSVGAITGGLMAKGQQTLTGPAGLTSGNLGAIASGKPLTTPTAATKVQTLEPVRGTMPRGSFPEQLAATPRATLATEGAVVGGAGIGAGIGAESDIQDPAEGAAFGEMLGSLGMSLSPLALTTGKAILSKGPTGRAISYLYGKTEAGRRAINQGFDRQAWRDADLLDKINPLNWKAFVDEAALEQGGRIEMLRLVRDLIPNQEIDNTVTQRLEVIRRLREIDPTFNPSFGAIVGTPAAKALQQASDYRSPELAVEMMQTNMKALRNIRSQLKKDPLYQYSDDLADMLEVIANDANITADLLTQQMDDMAAQLMKHTFSDTPTGGTPEAELVRKHFSNMKNVYDTFRREAYDSIEFPETVKIRVDRFDELLQEVNNPALPDTLSGSPFRSITSTLPKALEEARKEGMTLPYKTIQGFITRLGGEIADVRNTNQYSPFLPRAIEVRNALKQLRDGAIDSLPDEYRYLKEQKKIADAFFQDEYLPRIRGGEAEAMTAVRPDGRFQISDDALMRRYWQSGDKTEGAREFKRIFDEEATIASERLTPDAIQAVRQDITEARESLRRYAFYTLEQDLNRSAKGMEDPVAVLEKWRLKYKGALEEFPEIAKETENMETVFGTIAKNYQTAQKERDILNKSIIRKYFNADPDRVVGEFLKSRRSADQMLKNIESLYGANSAKVDEVKDALRIATMNRLMKDAYNPATDGFRYEVLANRLENSKESLSLIMGQKDYHDVLAFNQGLRIMNDQPGLATSANLNKLEETLKEAGVSFPSILSRYYAASLGKVGPFYLAADATSRFINKAADRYFTQMHREIMYDPNLIDNLEAVLKEAELGAAKGSFERTRGDRAALILSRMGINAYEDIEQIEEERAPLTPEASAEEVAVPQPVMEEKEEQEESLGQAPEGTEDGIYEDAQGNRIRVEGGQMYGQ